MALNLIQHQFAEFNTPIFSSGQPTSALPYSLHCQYVVIFCNL